MLHIPTWNARAENYKCLGTLEFRITLEKKIKSPHKILLQRSTKRKVKKYNSLTRMLSLSLSFLTKSRFFPPRKVNEFQTKIEAGVCHDGIGPYIGLDFSVNRGRVAKYVRGTCFLRATWYRDQAGGESSSGCDLKSRALATGCG